MRESVERVWDINILYRLTKLISFNMLSIPLVDCGRAIVCKYNINNKI